MDAARARKRTFVLRCQAGERRLLEGRHAVNERHTSAPLPCCLCVGVCSFFVLRDAARGFDSSGAWFKEKKMGEGKGYGSESRGVPLLGKGGGAVVSAHAVSLHAGSPMSAFRGPTSLCGSLATVRALDIAELSVWRVYVRMWLADEWVEAALIETSGAGRGWYEETHAVNATQLLIDRGLGEAAQTMRGEGVMVGRVSSNRRLVQA